MSVFFSPKQTDVVSYTMTKIKLHFTFFIHSYKLYYLFIKYHLKSMVYLFETKYGIT
ncbi:hypothetical protein UABAM_00036 [Candidatus Uabimicrobium amorphum]|uniref:Uncharacterized protein n=1 Tax=Uabimicrobium amorphum TaxID=2596890 RepID=A0A5S9F0K3_UABAM|nr:hypothetical protein UABAM_00036 [Candidatus Uabimicrobium amorphum]